MFGAEIKVVTSGNIWIDFIAPGTNKGAALSNLMKLFHVKPEECMYIGDTKTDMQTGSAAGMYTVGALWGFRDREELENNGADIVAAVPGDLFTIYEEKQHD